MMKIKADGPNGPVVVLGLSHANIDKLRSDGLSGAIKIDAKELGIPLDIWITAAETEQVMIDAFEGCITPQTKLHIDKRFKS